MDPVWLNQYNISTSEVLNNSKTDIYHSGSLEALNEPFRAFLVCLYTITSCLALTGNLLVIIVEVCGKRSAINMRKFLVNLALSDILLGVFSVPFTYTDFMFGRWIFQVWLCPTAQFVVLCTVFVTSYTLSVISIERFFAIIYPLSNKNQQFAGKCNLILIIGWIIGCSVASVESFNTITVSFEWDNNTYIDCRAEQTSDLNRKVYITSMFVLSFALPLLVQIISYVSIAKRLILNSSRLVSTQTHHRRDVKIIGMLVTVLIAFSVCWLPIKIFMLLVVFCPHLSDLTNAQQYYLYVGAYFICHWLSMANSFINPVIYSFMSTSFRADAKDLFALLCRKLSNQNASHRQKSFITRTSNI